MEATTEIDHQADCSISQEEVHFSYDPSHQNSKLGQTDITNLDNNRVAPTYEESNTIVSVYEDDSKIDNTSEDNDKTIDSIEDSNTYEDFLDLRQQNIIQEELINQLKEKVNNQDMTNLMQATKIMELDEQNRALRKENDDWEVLKVEQLNKHLLQSADQADQIHSQTEELLQLKKLCRSLKAIVSTSKNSDSEDGITPYQIAALDLATFDPKRTGSMISIENIIPMEAIFSISSSQCDNNDDKDETSEDKREENEIRTDGSTKIRFLGDKFNPEDECVESHMRVSMSDGTVLSWKGARSHLSNLTLPRGMKARKKVKFSKMKEEDRIDISQKKEKCPRYDDKDTRPTRQVNKQKITALLRACYLHNERK